MSTPVCIANAVADALGIEDVMLPITPAKLAAHIHGDEPAPKTPPAVQKGSTAKTGERALTGSGKAVVDAPRQQIWNMLLDPATLMSVIPGAHNVEKVGDSEFYADVTLGIGPVKGRYKAAIKLSDMKEPDSVTLSGGTEGALGSGHGTGFITLTEDSGKTIVAYTYEAAVGGKVASIGGRLLDGAAKVVIGQFFEALTNKASGKRGSPLMSAIRRLLALLGVSR